MINSTRELAMAFDSPIQPAGLKDLITLILSKVFDVGTYIS
jgi:hypothetical protein